MVPRRSGWPRPGRLLPILAFVAVLAACAASESGQDSSRQASADQVSPAPRPAAKPVASDLPRILVSPSTQWGWVRDSSDEEGRRALLRARREQQEYYRALGFTHVTYGLDPEHLNHWTKVSGTWTYAPHGSPTGADSSLAAAKRQAESRGLRLIPQLAGPSHMSAFITWLDSSLSEFGGRAAFREWYAGTGLPHDPANLDHVAALGDNPAADQFFEGQLRLIARAWDADPRGGPGYIHIGHDELGFDSVCYVKAGRTRDDPRTRSELVAQEIDLRVAQVARVLGDSVKVILYGDSFLPTDLGERYGLAGKGEDGNGGVLHLLRHKYRLQDRLIIMPWTYILENGDVHYWSRLRYDKDRQIRLLDRLGFGYIPGTGEHGSGGDPSQDRLAPPFSLGMPEKSIRCLLEWVAASRRRPAMLKGWAHQVYEPYDFCSPDGLCTGFSAPVLAYAAWLGPPSAGGDPGASLTKGVDYRKSRKDQQWIRGLHYPGK